MIQHYNFTQHLFTIKPRNLWPNSFPNSFMSDLSFSSDQNRCPSNSYQYQCRIPPAVCEKSLCELSHPDNRDKPLSMSPSATTRVLKLPAASYYFERASDTTLFISLSLSLSLVTHAKLCLHLLLLLCPYLWNQSSSKPSSIPWELASVIELSDCVCICLRGRMLWRAIARMLMTFCVVMACVGQHELKLVFGDSTSGKWIFFSVLWQEPLSKVSNCQSRAHAHIYYRNTHHLTSATPCSCFDRGTHTHLPPAA